MYTYFTKALLFIVVYSSACNKYCLLFFCAFSSCVSETLFLLTVLIITCRPRKSYNWKGMCLFQWLRPALSFYTTLRASGAR